MPSQKRDELLTQLERDRLISRDKKTLAANDVRAQKKLSAWLKNIQDVLLILKYLPEDQKRDIINDSEIFALLTVAERMLGVKEFHSISGEFRDPVNWGISPTCGDTRSYMCDPRSLDKASDLDIRRSVLLNDHIVAIEGFLGSNNPVTVYGITEQLISDPRFKEHILPGDIAGMERIRQAFKNEPIQPRLEKMDLNRMVDSEQPPK